MPATGYIGKLQIDSGDILPIGSTLFGVCRTDANEPNKTIINTEQYPDSLAAAFSPLMDGITIHVKFQNGNTATTGLSLKVGDTAKHNITNPGGTLNWSPGAIISFTYDGENWVCNDGTVTTINVGNEVARALSNLDVDNDSASALAHHITGFGPDKTLATLTEVDGIIYATFQDISITTSQISDFPTLGDAAEKDTVSSIGANANNDHDTVPTTGAVASYIANKTAGLTGAMHFKGTTTTAMSDGLTTSTVVIGGSNYTPNPGDVVLSGEHQEYVWTETNTTTHAGYWELLGDEGSYLLASSVQNKQVIDSITFNQGTLPAITLANATNVLTGITNASGDNQARVTSATVQSGVLKITTGVLQQFNTSTVKGVTSVTEGTLPTLTPSTTQVLQAVT